MKSKRKVWQSFFMTVSWLAMIGTAPVWAEPQFNVGISGGSQGITGFNLSVGEYYRVPEREVVVVHERGVPEEELPVVFFLSERAHVRPEVIVDMRLHKRMSWMDITLHYGLSPEIYYVPVSGPPYGKAYGYYGKHHKKHWRRMRLKDPEVVNQVNLRFMSEHYGYAPDRVMRYRNEGRNFVVIDNDIRREKHGKKNKEWKQQEKEMKHQEKGKKDKDKGKKDKGGKGHGQQDEGDGGHGHGHGNG